MKPLSPLNGHPDRNKVAGVEANTGPLGHGLPIAVGMALAAKIDHAAWRTFVLTGDGELQEGSNWEAAMSAAHRQLDNLTLIVDRNRLQQGDTTERTVSLEPLHERWRAFGWQCRRRRWSRCRRAARHLAACADRSRSADVPHRAHTQGPRRVLHGRQGRVAPPRADRRGARGGAARAGAAGSDRRRSIAALPSRIRSSRSPKRTPASSSS